MRISSIFHDKDSISLFREDRDDRKILKMVDNDNPSKFIYIELVEKEEVSLQEITIIILFMNVPLQKITIIMLFMNLWSNNLMK